MKQINLTRNKIAFVDDDDFERISKYKWRLQTSHYCKYAISGDSPNVILMHRMILGTPKGIFIDHIDGDGLNNQKSNLRQCTHAQNMMNRCKHKLSASRYKGVRAGDNKWRAIIKMGGVRINIGRYESEIEAAMAYDRAARMYFGEFARTNF